MKEPAVSESVEQQCLFRWAQFASGQHPELNLLYHIPNGGARSKATAGRLKAEGVKAGVPDICLPVARGGYHGLYIELKKEHSGTTSQKQKEWLFALSEQGYQAVVCHGWEEAKQEILEYLKGEKDNERNRSMPILRTGFRYRLS